MTRMLVVNSADGSRLCLNHDEQRRQHADCYRRNCLSVKAISSYCGIREMHQSGALFMVQCGRRCKQHLQWWRAGFAHTGLAASSLIYNKWIGINVHDLSLLGHFVSLCGSGFVAVGYRLIKPHIIYTPRPPLHPLLYGGHANCSYQYTSSCPVPRSIDDSTQEVKVEVFFLFFFFFLLLSFFLSFL